MAFEEYALQRFILNLPDINLVADDLKSVIHFRTVEFDIFSHKIPAIFSAFFNVFNTLTDIQSQ